MKHVQKKNWFENWIFLIKLWLSKVHVYRFLNWIHRFPQSCSLLSVEKLWIFVDMIQSLVNVCLCDVCSLILTEPHTNGNLGVWLRKLATWDPSTLSPRIKSLIHANHPLVSYRLSFPTPIRKQHPKIIIIVTKAMGCGRCPRGSLHYPGNVGLNESLVSYSETRKEVHKGSPWVGSRDDWLVNLRWPIEHEGRPT